MQSVGNRVLSVYAVMRSMKILCRSCAAGLGNAQADVQADVNPDSSRGTAAWESSPGEPKLQRMSHQSVRVALPHAAHLCAHVLDVGA